MKIAFIGFLSIILSGSAYAQQEPGDKVFLFCYFKDNGQDGLHLAYSYDRYHWTALHHDSTFLKPMVGKEKLMRDPCILKGPDGLFHMVWTASWHGRGIGYAHSKDLAHWSKQKFIPVMSREKEAKNCWAPEVFYDRPSGQYMIYWATTIPGRFPNSDTSGDEKYNHRIYYTTTKDFLIFSHTKLLYDQGFNVIDATIQRADNKYIMFLKDETLKPVPQKNLHLAFSSHLTYGYGPPSPSITGNYWAEGPTVLHTDSQWIVYLDKYNEHTMGAVLSTDLINWEDISDKIVFPTGTRHGTVFIVSKAEFDRL